MRRLSAGGAVVLLIASCACGGGEDGPALRAQFSERFDHTVEGPLACPVVAVHFTDESTGEPTEWEWTFEATDPFAIVDEPATSSEQNPTWAPGAYSADVTLKVSRDGSEDSITRHISTGIC
jgi:hypothetical protein